VDRSNEPGDPVEVVLARLRQHRPAIRIERLRVKYPADDDNLWFIGGTAGSKVQIETGPDHAPPFLIEGDQWDQRRHVPDVDAAVALILDWLGDD
jgi:hypothetical protein